MQAKLLSALVASACLYTVNGIAETSIDDTGATFPYLPPDYTIPKFTYTPNLADGTTEIAITLLNQGLAPYSSQRSPLYLTLSTGTSPLDSDNLLNRKYIDLLGDFGSRSYSWTAKTSTLSKNIYAILDPDNYIAESNEDNNSAVAVRQAAVGAVSAEMQSSLYLPSDNVGFVGDNIAMEIDVNTNSILKEEIFGIIAVIAEDGTEVYVSDSIPLYNANAETTYEAGHYWGSTGEAVGTYTLVMSVWGEVSGKMDEITGSLTLQANVENNRPIANDDIASTLMNESVEIDIQGNDLEPDGNGFNHYISGEPMHGDVEVLRGVATYTPEEGFVGVDYFSYQMNDYSGASDWAKVTVDVLPAEHGCTWIRDFEVVTSTEKTALDGWSDYELPENGRAENAALVQGNSNPDLFDVQPFISFPSCSLYFQPKPGVTGTTTVVYSVLDKATNGETYTSETRTFEIMLMPETALPEFVSTPPTITQVNKAYTYFVELSDDSATLTALELPDFLTLEDGVVSGTPAGGNADVGMHTVILVIDDGVQSARQEYLLTVEPEISTIENPHVVVPPSPLSDDESAANEPELGGAADGDDNPATGVVQTGGSGGFNPFWLLLSLPLLRRLR